MRRLPLRLVDLVHHRWAVPLVGLLFEQDGAKFVSEKFMDSLRENGRRPGSGFYFDRVFLFEGVKVEVAAVGGLAPTTPTLFGGRGRGVATGGGGPGVSSGLPPEKLDPLTNESIEGDWKFVIWADVICEEMPELDGGEGE